MLNNYVSQNGITIDMTKYPLEVLYPRIPCLFNLGFRNLGNSKQVGELGLRDILQIDFLLLILCELRIK